MTMTRVRIAPSPTGLLHIGTARTAIFNSLFASKEQGAFILRIEDTDKERSQKEYEEDIIESLSWLGLQWDEGPFRQSERLTHYQQYLQQLLDQDKAYFCFCSKAKLAKERAEQMKKKLAPRYAGHCAALNAKEQQAQLKKSKDQVIRFRNPSGVILEFKDLVRNKVRFASEEFDDFVIAKDRENPLYNFTVVVDDFLMKISHVIRGEDHLSNTAKQILLEQALDFPTPKFAHLPLIVDAKRAKLSKREGGVAVRDFRAQGFLPEALVNYLILLGWHPHGNNEIFSFNDAAAEFSLERVQKSAATWDEHKLLWLNGHYIRGLSGLALLERLLPYLEQAGLIFLEDDGKIGLRPSGETITKLELAKAVELTKDRLKLLSEGPEMLAFVFGPDYEADLLIWKEETKAKTKAYLAKAKELLDQVPAETWNQEVLHGTLFKYLDEHKIGRSNLLWPLRVALSSKKSSPGTFELLAYLGKEESFRRLNQAIAKLA